MSLRRAAPGAGGDGADARSVSGRRGLAMLLSLAVAFALWFSFSMRETYVLSLTVPIEVGSVPAGEALRAPPPRTVTAQVRGDGWTLLSLSRAVPAVRLAASTPQVDVVAALSSGGLPAGVSVVSAQPRVVELQLEERTTRRVPVRLVSQLSFAPSHGLRRPPVLAPDSVTASGARSILRDLDAWPTEPLTGDEVRAPFSRWVPLRDTLGGLVETGVRQTLVRADVGEFTEGTRRLRVVVRGRPAGAPEVRFDPAEVFATYRVPADVTYDRAAADPAFVAVVEYADVVRDTVAGTVPLTPRVPPGLDVSDVSVSPSRVGYFLLRPSATP